MQMDNGVDLAMYTQKEKALLRLFFHELIDSTIL